MGPKVTDATKYEFIISETSSIVPIWSNIEGSAVDIIVWSTAAKKRQTPIAKRSTLLSCSFIVSCPAVISFVGDPCTGYLFILKENLTFFSNSKVLLGEIIFKSSGISSPLTTADIFGRLVSGIHLSDQRLSEIKILIKSEHLSVGR